MPGPDGPDTVAIVSIPAVEGAAAEAIGDAEAALARQNSVAARIDLEVVAALRDAHATHATGTAALDCLHREIEAALALRAGLDSPTGARELQRYLVDKLNDVRSVVAQTDLDDAEKATLAAALAGRYPSSDSMESSDDLITDVGPLEFPDPEPETTDSAVQPTAGPAVQPAAAFPSMPAIPQMPSLGGGMPGIAPLLPGLAALAGQLPEQPPDPTADPPGVAEDPSDDGYAGVIAEAVSGTPIADAFDHQGISVPDPGTPVTAPLSTEQVVAGDIALFDDRYALALGNGKALLDDQIQPIESINRPGFLGWQHPPDPIAEPD